MIRLAALLSLFAALLALASDAHADIRLRLHLSPIPPPAPSVPILDATAINEGTLTRTGGGDVQFSASNLGLVDPSSPGTITAWSVTQTGGTSGHFSACNGTTLTTGSPVSCAESNTANAPVPTAAGQSAGLNGGPYTFSITATSSVGTSSPVTLTYNTVSGWLNVGNENPPSQSALNTLVTGGMLGIYLSTGTERGNYDTAGASNGSCITKPVKCRTFLGLTYPGGSASGSISGTTLTLTSGVTGAAFAVGQYLSGIHAGSVAQTGYASVAPFTKITGGSGSTWTVTPSQTVDATTVFTGFPVQDADPNRPAHVVDYEIDAANYMIFNQLPITLTNSSGSSLINGNGSNWLISGDTFVAVNNSSFNITIPTGNLIGFECVNSQNAVLANYYTSGTSSGFSDADCTNVEVNNLTVWDYQNNAGFMQDGSYWYLHDSRLIGPAGPPGVHVDALQNGNNTAPQNMTIRRVVVFDGNANAYGQTIDFGATGWQAPCYMDDGLGGGSYDGVPGNSVTCSTATVANGSIINSGTLIAAPGLTGAPHFTAGPTPPTAGVYTITGTAQAIAPTVFHTYYLTNLTVDGVLYGGCALYGPYNEQMIQGGWKHVTYLKLNTGQLPYSGGGELCGNTGPGVFYGNPTNTTGAAPLYAGPTLFTRNFFQGSNASSPSTITYDATTVFGGNAIPSNAFANANPETAIEALPASTWTTNTPEQQVRILLPYVEPKTGGPLDNGGGDFSGAFNQSGQWNDGSGVSP